MRILQICNKIPFPVVDGGTAAMNQLSQGLLTAGYEVKIIAVNTHKQNFSTNQLSDEYIRKFQPEYIYLDTKIKPHSAFFNLFSSGSYNVNRFDSLKMHQKLEEVLSNEKFDVVILDSLFVTPYIATIRRNSSAKIILRTHNVEHVIWQRKSATENNLIKRKYLEFLTSRLKKYELKTVPLVDGIAAISLEDVDFFKKHFNVPVSFTPFGYFVKPQPQTDNFQNSKGYFLGSMDWSPNIEAVKWIKNNILPHLIKSKSFFHLTLAGNKMPDDLLELSGEQFSFKGKIDHPEKFLEDFGVLIAPIFSGGGLKIKVVEAMANGKLVVTTPIGAEGLGATPGEHFLLCENKDDFISAINFCENNKNQAAEIAKSGQNFVRENYDIVKIINNLCDFINQIDFNSKNP